MSMGSMSTPSCQSKRPSPSGEGWGGRAVDPRRPVPSLARVSAPHPTDKVNAPPARPGAAFTLSCYREFVVYVVFAAARQQGLAFAKHCKVDRLKG